MPLLDFARVDHWLNAVAAEHDRRAGNLTYLLCDDRYILEQNRQFLGHDYYTDIITFDYSRGDRVAGDMMISLDTVRSNAEGLGLGFDRELLRVVAHGLLHLCGLKDKTAGERAVMEAAENRALEIYDNLG